MIFGIQLECTIGSVNLLLIYLISGIGGNLLSSLVTDSLGVGASTAISGILITYVSWIILNWTYLEPVK
jgi:membrane associated rhomboid family serine protease